MPRGFPFGSVSGICGRPVDAEKRTVIGVEEVLKCGADVRLAASAEGVKVPVRRWPLAWAIDFVSDCWAEIWVWCYARDGWTHLDDSLDEDQLHRGGWRRVRGRSRRLGRLLRGALCAKCGSCWWYYSGCERNKRLVDGINER
jgi:hypothetical protein